MRDSQARILLVALLVGLGLTGILLLSSDTGLASLPSDGLTHVVRADLDLGDSAKEAVEPTSIEAEDQASPEQGAGAATPDVRLSAGAGDSRVYRGSLLSADSLQPMAGFQYKVTSGDKTLLTGAADSVGQFEFRVHSFRNPVLQAIPPEGYRIIFAPLRLPDLDEIECQEIELFVRLERSGPLKGKLISDQSLLPLPFAWVSIEDELGAVSEFKSDYTGWMEFEKELAGGVLKVTPLGPNGKPQGRTNLVDFQGLGYPEEMLSLPIDAGPIIRLELVGPSHLLAGPLEARIFPIKSEDSEFRADAEILQLPPTPVIRQIPAHWELPPNGNAQYGWIQVSGGLESTLAQAGLLRGAVMLEVYAPGSMYVGLRKLSLINETLPREPLRIELLPTASIKGRVTDENGAPIFGATISLNAQRLHFTQTDESGKYLLDNLPIEQAEIERQTLTVSAYAKQTDVQHEYVHLKSGQEYEIHWKLQTLATKPYQFVVYSPYSDIELPSDLLITHNNRLDWEFRPAIQTVDPKQWDLSLIGLPEAMGTFDLRLFENAHDFEASLSFLDLAPNGAGTTWKVELVSGETVYVRAKRTRSDRTPCEKLSTKRQLAERTDIHLRAISADTGRPIPEFTGYAFQGEQKGVSLHSKQVNTFPDTRFNLSKCDDEVLVMGIGAAGYAPTLVTKAQLYELESPSPFKRTGLDCQLQRGWGAIIQIYETSTKSLKTERVKGERFVQLQKELRVLFDGLPMHYEVIEGFLVVSHSTPPKSLELQSPGWGTSIVLQAEGPLHLAVFAQDPEPRKRRTRSPSERFAGSYRSTGFNAIPKEIFDTLYTAVEHFSALQPVEEYDW